MSLFAAAGKVAGGVVGAQLLTALAVPVLTRLYAPEAFSLFAYYFSVSSILSTVCYLRLDVLVSRYGEEECANRILPALAQMLKLTVPLVLAAACLVQLCFPPPAGAPGVAVGAVLICLAATSFASFNVHAIFLSKQRRFSAMAAARLLRSGSAIAAQLALVFFGKAVFLFVGELIGRVLGSLAIRRSSGRSHQGGQRGDWQGFVQVFKGHLELVKYGFPALLLNSAALNLYPILLSASYPAQQVGVYFLVHKMVATPITLIAQSISVALLGDIGRHLPHRKSALRSEVLRVFLLLLPLGLLFFGLLWLGMERFSHLLFGPGWDGASDIVLLLIPLLALQVSTTPFSQLLNVLARSGWQLAWDAARLALVLGSVAGPLLLALEPAQAFRLTLAVYSFGSAALYLVHMVLIRHALSDK
ncbi:hypothetical protein GCM10027082_05110 [Comamonas humi]